MNEIWHSSKSNSEPTFIDSLKALTALSSQLRRWNAAFCGVPTMRSEVSSNGNSEDTSAFVDLFNYTSPNPSAAVPKLAVSKSSKLEIYGF